MDAFRNAVSAHLKTLDLYVPVVARVHGEHHPEFHEVKRIYDEMRSLLQDGVETADFSPAFADLRRITSDYEVPSDVCESYEAVYRMLAELNNAYENSNYSKLLSYF